MYNHSHIIRSLLIHSFMFMFIQVTQSLINVHYVHMHPPLLKGSPPSKFRRNVM